MIEPQAPANEAARLTRLHSYEILDTLPEQTYDDVVALAAAICEVPIAVISLIDEERQWFKARHGLDAQETPRAVSFCGHVVESSRMLVVTDPLSDPRFADNPLVLGDPRIRFYAGAPLRTDDQLVLGTVCVIDCVPRTLTPEQLALLESLSRLVMSQLELRLELKRSTQLRQELTRSNADLDQFATVTSHDLREPLRAVTAFCGLLKSKYGDELDETANSYLDRAIHGAARMKALIADLLRYARAGHGAEMSLCDLNQTVDDAIADLQGSITESSAQLTRKPLPLVFGDPTQLRLLFRNLIGNSIKYRSESAPHIQIESECTSDTCTIQIHDNGIGFDPKHNERVFELFHRLDPDCTPEGTGMGLALCRRIVERHGGSISATPTPGRGTTFTFTLPLNAPTLSA